MAENLQKLLHTETDADWTISCQNFSFRVHKSIIRLSSDYFDRICSSQFSEGLSGSVQLDDENPAIVARAILWMYGSTYPTRNIAGDSEHPECHQFTAVDDPFKDEDFEDSEYWLHRAHLHCVMYAFGDAYLMPRLKDYSRYRFLLAISGNDEHNSDSKTRSADGDIEDDLKAEDNALWEELAPIIELIYSSTPPNDRGLRNMMLQFISLRLYLTQLSTIVEFPAFRDLLKDLPDLQWELLTMPLSTRDYKCTNCERTTQKDQVGTIAQRCACGKVGSCRKRQCAEAAVANTCCAMCLSLDCMMLQDEEIDEEESDDSEKTEPEPEPESESATSQSLEASS